MTIQSVIFIAAIIIFAVLGSTARRKLKLKGCGRCPRYGEGCATCANMHRKKT